MTSGITAIQSDCRYVESFDNKIFQLAHKDTAEAVAGAAVALATMELARQQTISNLIAYLAAGKHGENMELVIRAAIEEALNLDV